MDTETLMTVKEVATLKGVTDAAVYVAIKARQLTAVEALGRVVVDKSVADAWKPLKTPSERGKRGGRPKTKNADTEATE